MARTAEAGDRTNTVFGLAVKKSVGVPADRAVRVVGTRGAILADLAILWTVCLPKRLLAAY
jgi:hypothetical protein